MSAIDKWSLRGTTALVTGGTRGIGHAIVEELARLGAVIYTCSEDEAELQECLSRWEAAGLGVQGSACDVASHAAREELVERVKAAFNGHLNILVNNAGIGWRKPIVEHTAEDYMCYEYKSGLYLPSMSAFSSSSQGFKKRHHHLHLFHFRLSRHGLHIHIRSN